MSEPAAAVPPAAPRPTPTATTASRVRRERDNLIIDSLNRGLSMAEIADAIGVSDKRMRALVWEVLARRLPSPPEVFAAIQTSRLNAALGVAYNSMMKGDLRALDRVVRIVRELDRYAGFGGGKRLESRPQPTEKVGFTPGIALADDEEAALSEASWEREFAPMGEPDQGPPPLAPPLDIRPETPSQGLEKIDSAPGISRPETPDDLIVAAASEPAHAGMSDPDQGPPPLVTPLDAGPEIPSQSLEKIDSVPGISAAFEAVRGAAPEWSRARHGEDPLPPHAASWRST